jgi:hypothetical protein
MVGCDLESGVDSDQLELVGHPETDESFETVHIKMTLNDPTKPYPNHFNSCSGIALTDHWILTAAHCLDDLDDAPFELSICSGTCDIELDDDDRDVLYDGTGQRFMHPDWGGLGSFSTDDTGLIKLHGSGMRGAPRGRFYSDERTPWYDPYPASVPLEDRMFHIIGYGWGSDPGGDGCDEDHTDGLTLGVKRIAEGLHFLARDYPNAAVQSGGGYTGACGGDSGTPWFLERGGKRLAFATHSAHEDTAWWDDSKASLIPRKWDWILSTTAAAGLPIECQTYQAGGYDYEMCEDDPVFVRIESEWGIRSGPMALGTNKFASQSTYVWVPNGAGTGGRVVHTFYVPRDGYYRVWGRVLTPSTDDDQFYVRMDGDAGVDWDAPTSPPTSWIWDAVPKDYELEEGWHTIDINQIDDGAKLDRIVVTSAMTWQPWEVWIEAEHGWLVWPMRSILGDGTNYITVPNGAGAGGGAYYSFGLQPPGQYHIWGLVKATSGGDNSFFVTVGEGDELAWHTPVRSDWFWDRVSDYGVGDISFDLAAGWHTLDIVRREDGTRLDRILITNDAGFTPKHVKLGISLPTL